MDYKETLNLPQTDFPMKANLTQREPNWAKEWEKENLYPSILKARKKERAFILHDGPPYANGNIHMGHAFNKILKDMIVKHKTMQGFYSYYVPGWDCHGLPVEHALFKVLGKTKDQVDQVEFRRKAHDYALKYVGIQKEQFKRLGIFADWEHPYLTLAPDYEAEIIRSFVELYEKGYIYKGLKPIYWCLECETALAEAEVEYDNHQSPSVYVAFPFEKKPAPFAKAKQLSAVIWTTTPWTLPANLAIALHPEALYVAAQVESGTYLVAKELLPQLAEKCGWKNPKIVGECRGKELEGERARHPFMNRDSQIILGDHVTLDTGTGCVHTAPGHGQEDYEVGLKYKLDIYSPVNHKGRFDNTVPLWEGENVFKANPKIVAFLKEKGALLFDEKVEHSYPHCWRCKGAVIFRATTQWFISMAKNNLRKEALAEIKKVKWVPAIGENRISSMVEQRPDWCLSRQRLWGVPIPVFNCQGCQGVLLNKEIGKRVVDLVAQKGADAWFTEPVETFLPKEGTCPKCGGKEFKKESDIVDVWFDSGVSHRAVLGLRENLSSPADLYLEGSDQHRGWFQSSLLTAVGLDHRAPYKQVLTHGFVVDGEGKKMSKSLGNVISPEDVMKNYGADILRLWISSVDFSADVRISDSILKQTAEAYRKIRNTFKFILGNLYDFDYQKEKVATAQLNELDKWALSKAAHLCDEVTRYFDQYEFYKGYQAIYRFCIVEMSSFYLDILKDRLYTFGKKSFERLSSQTVLAEILSMLVRLVSPILVFTAEEVYKEMPAALREATNVHLSPWPSVAREWKNETVEKKFDQLMQVREGVLRVLEQARQEKLIGNPLEASLQIYTSDKSVAKLLQENFQLLAPIFIVSEVKLTEKNENSFQIADSNLKLFAKVDPAEGAKCGRCWKYRREVGQSKEHPELCAACVSVVNQFVEQAKP